MRRPLTPCLLLLAAIASAAPLTLNVADEGWRALTGKSFPAPTSLTDGIPASGGKIALKEIPAGSRLYVYDQARNLGVVGTAEALGKTTIGPEAVTHLLNVTVSLVETVDGKPKPFAGEAVAEFTDSERIQSARTTNGTLTFRWVRLGDAGISVTTRGTDNAPRLVVEKVKVEGNGLSGYTLNVAGGSAASGSGSSGAVADGGEGRATNAPAPASTGGSVVGNILSTLIGLGVVGGLAFAAWRYAQANPDKVKGALTRIGADVPKPLDPEDPPAAIPASTPAPAVPSGPIILDPTPEPIQLSAAPISFASAPTGVPKLLGSDGSAFELPEGETVVGREALGGLMVSHETVSRRHARLLRAGSSVTVEDLGSTNGTWVNDAPAPGVLQGGETVRFGQVAYRYEA